MHEGEIFSIYLRQQKITGINPTQIKEQVFLKPTLLHCLMVVEST